MCITVKSFQSRFTLTIQDSYLGLTGAHIKNEFFNRQGVPIHLQRLYHHGRPFSDEDVLSSGESIYVCLSMPGGKGGFGSMLRAIGAQIEKTTNREACRDLSGRRLRDINEEKRLKEWISKQAEREQNMHKKKIEKLERMKAKPKHEFHDPEYDRDRSELPEKVTDSVLEGLKKESSALKRKSTAPVSSAKKKNCMWLGMDELECDDSDLSEEENKDKKESDEQRTGNPLAKNDTHKSEDNSAKTNRLTLDLSQFQSVHQLHALGGEALSQALGALGAKCGGTLEQKAERLWALKGKGTLKKLHGPADIVL